MSRWPLGTVLAWVILLTFVATTAPPMADVAKDGEFDFLPHESSSRAAERAFREAFPAERPNPDPDADAETEQAQMDPLGCSVVIVLQREDIREGLTTADEEFVTTLLEPRLREIQARTGEGYFPKMLSESPTPIPKDKQIIRGVWTFSDSRIGPLLKSQDGHSTLVLVELTTEFLNRGNKLVLSRIEELLSSKEVQAAKPAGLDVNLSGAATVGRDMVVAEAESARRTDHYTLVLVVVLLFAIYRAPLMVLIPLVTVGVAVPVALSLLRIMAKAEIVGVFAGLEVFIRVVVYGAGIDFCLFLMSRYKEELDRGASFKDATTLAVQHVGAALATSAGTSIVGIGMLTLTEFGKFRQAGVAISFGLFVALICAMTLTPAMMYLFGRWTFWPDVRRERISASEGFIPARSIWGMLKEQRLLERIWESIAGLISRRPGWVFVGTILFLTPLALVGACFKDHLSYGLLSDLQADVTSVKGAKAVQKHFPAGAAGVTTFLIQHDDLDLTNVRSGEKISKFISDQLMGQSDVLGIADVRSQSFPHGAMKSEGASNRLGIRRIGRTIAQKAYCSLADNSELKDGTLKVNQLKGKLMRMDIVFQTDPFARDAVTRLDQAERAIRGAMLKYPLPEEGEAKRIDYSTAKILALGSTASIRDLKAVTDRDQIRINIFVSLAVFLVLMTLLRQPALCAYLILTVIYSYLATLGAAYILFRFTTGPDFVGLDWKVPVYLFTLLLALGEDYNVLFMSRVTEEQPKHGAIPGILIALTKTGGIISSCGVIMAGTFASLMTGTLAGMVQLGFALAFGVMVDTFIVRPILVPAYLVLLNNGTFGRMSKLLGAYQPQATDPAVIADTQAALARAD